MTFSKIFGHEKVIERLVFSWENNRIPSAYLFIGWDGIGKNTLIKEYAQMLNCDTHSNCQQCNNCRMFKNIEHPDFIIIKPSGKFIRIAQIQGLIEQLSLKPIYATKRVVVIHEAHRMNLESANCFLKILEEPPLDTLIILMTTDESLLLETIQSRCQKVMFSTLTRDQLKKIYGLYFNIQADEETFILNYSNGRIRKKFIENASELFNMRFQILEMLLNLKNTRLIEFFSRMEQWIKQELYHYFFEFTSSWLRDFIYLLEGKTEGFYNQDIIEKVPDISRKFTIEQLQWIFDLTIETETALQMNAAKQLALEGLLIQYKQIVNGIPVI
ncbi:MAG: AAA family ATPase [Deltaproteobacteria bacterium]|jgi:DNA polymerase III subunit delta'|nr:AAA family ATPase [Deltaproteobacteria bacterium]